jgi:hypothetical protein
MVRASTSRDKERAPPAMSERPYTIRPYQAGDETAILALFNEVFGEDDPEFRPRTLEQWRWLYERNPAGRHVMLAVEPGGRVVAQYACLPVRAKVGDEVVIAIQGVDSMVHADYRRGLRREGAFLQTARAYFVTMGRWPPCGFGYGFPNRRAFPVGVRLIGYVPVVKPVPTLYRNFFESGDDDEVGRAHAGAADVVEVERFGPEMDELWARLAPRFPMAIVRDHAYLAWRYDGCPWIPHRKFLVREKGSGALRGFFVTRSRFQRQPIHALVDYLGAPEDEAGVALALRTATRLAREGGEGRVEAWLPERHPSFRHALAAGFRTEPCQYVLCVMNYREQPDVDWMRDRWYYTIGDSDVA